MKVEQYFAGKEKEDIVNTRMTKLEKFGEKYAKPLSRLKCACFLNCNYNQNYNYKIIIIIT